MIVKVKDWQAGTVLTHKPMVIPDHVKEEIEAKLLTDLLLTKSDDSVVIVDLTVEIKCFVSREHHAKAK